MFENQPSLILTSNGAEVIMIAKSLFHQYTTDATLRELRLSVSLKVIDMTDQKSNHIPKPVDTCYNCSILFYFF